MNRNKNCLLERFSPRCGVYCSSRLIFTMQIVFDSWNVPSPNSVSSRYSTDVVCMLGPIKVNSKTKFHCIVFHYYYSLYYFFQNQQFLRILVSTIFFFCKIWFPCCLKTLINTDEVMIWNWIIIFYNWSRNLFVISWKNKSQFSILNSKTVTAQLGPRCSVHIRLVR